MLKILLLSCAAVSLLISNCHAFSLPANTANRQLNWTTSTCLASLQQCSSNDDGDEPSLPLSSRRQNLQQLLAVCGGAVLTTTTGLATWPLPANADMVADREKERQYIQESYADFTKSKEGYLYREVKPGTGEKAKEGDRVVFDWSGYTIGYFGRPFQAKGGPQGGAFSKDIDFDRVVIGSGKMVKGLELALKDMKPGEVRQVVIPYGELSYPPDDETHDRVGPKPTTFSGQRALNFVLDNPRLDRTLLFNLKAIRVDKSDGKGGFIRG